MVFTIRVIQVGRNRFFPLKLSIDLDLDEDILRQPTVYGNRKNVLIEQVEIDMEPSINMFEDELCRLINKDRMEKKRMTATTAAALVQETHNKVSIVERRLRV